MRNICIVGYGSVAPLHAKALSDIEDVRLWGVCDIDPSRNEKFLSEYGGRAFTDYDEMLSCGEVDGVHICTPHYLHYEMARKALLKNKTVVIEKPVTMKSDEFEELISRFPEGKVCVMFQNRTNGSVCAMKKIIANEDLGSFITARSLLTWHRTAEYYAHDSWRGKKKTEGGGVLINQALHSLDLISYLTGGISSVKATMSNKSLNGVIDVEDTVDGLIKFKNGGQGVFYATNAYGSNSSMFVELVFEKDTLRYIDGRLYRKGEAVAEDCSSASGKSYWGCGHESVLREFYGGGEGITLKSAANSMRAAFAMYESAENNGKEILIKE